MSFSIEPPTAKIMCISKLPGQDMGYAVRLKEGHVVRIKVGRKNGLNLFKPMKTICQTLWAI